MRPKEAIVKYNLDASHICYTFSRDKICPACGNRDGIWAEVNGQALFCSLGHGVDYQYSSKPDGIMTCAKCSTSGSVEGFTIEGLDDELERMSGLGG